MTKLRIWRAVVTVFVAVSLLLNVVLIVGLLRARNGLLSALSVAENALTLSTSKPLIFEVAVDQEIPIETTIPVDQDFTVPLEFDYELNTVINTYVDIPLLGRQDIAVPVETMIPIRTTLEIPVTADVPISVTYQLQASIPVEVDFPPTVLNTFENFAEKLESSLRFPSK